MNKPQINQEQITNALNTCYEKALVGVPGSKDCYTLAKEYQKRYDDIDDAISVFVKNQIAKCTSSGFLTSLGGFITLPIAIPANITTVWYVQLRMIATIAVMCGFEPSEDEVRTLAYVCLTGSSASKIFREAGVTFGNKLTLSAVKKIPGEVLVKVNQKVGFRFITKAGEKGIINITKLVPIVGGFIGGTIDFVGTRIVANCAIKTFKSKNLN